MVVLLFGALLYFLLSGTRTAIYLFSVLVVMRRLIITLSVFSLIGALSYFGLDFFSEPSYRYQNDYLAALSDKHRRVHEVKGPTLIFAGGSNLAFGLDSEQIEKGFLMPTVNLGLHAGLGLDFILNELRDVVQAGDIVFLSLEYYMGEGSYELRKFAGRCAPEAKYYYSFNPIEEISIQLEKTRKQLKGNTQFFFDSVYVRSGFNHFGDVVSHLESPRAKELRSRVKEDYRYWEGIPMLNNFYAEVSAREVQVYYLFPCYAKSEFEVNSEAIYLLAKDLAADLDFEIINSVSDFVFEDSLFFDTVYHLNKKGRDQRTKKLIEIIRKSKAMDKIEGLTTSRMR